jgi:hypothetical protein
MKKKIALVTCGSTLDINKCLLECLTSAKEYGITFNIYNWLQNSGRITDDAVVFLDMAPTFGGVDQPFVCVENGMSCEQIEDKMADLADFINKNTPFTDDINNYIVKATSKECSFFGEDIYAPKVISLSEIGFNTENETVSLPFDYMVAEIDGKEVKLSRDDILGVSKVYNLMKEFGYKIKEVVVCTPS